MFRWAAVCRQRPVGPILTLDPGKGWLPPDFRGFHMLAFDVLDIFNKLVFQVVVAGRENALQAWRRWLNEDLRCHPYQWLTPGQVLPAPEEVCPQVRPRGGSGILVQPSLIDAHFRKTWMSSFGREGKRSGNGSSFSGLCPKPLLPVFTGEDVHSAALT